MQADNESVLSRRPPRNKPVVPVYDLSVLWFSNTFVWRCPTHLMRTMYTTHVSARHLDVGVGTGYFLDTCTFPTRSPAITLVDINPLNLQRAAARIARYQPQTHQANILEPLNLPNLTVDSVGMNYLLHCLPGTLRSKAVVFEHVKPFLSPGGVVFGSTILGEGVPHNRLAHSFLRFYNRKGIFCNVADRREDLEAALATHFRTFSVSTVGSVAFFTAWT